MSVHLAIQDGSPWWISPDIWVVPGSDPNGPAGSPIAGTSNFVWARVSNAGNTPVNGCRLDFYWANPSAAVEVGVATFIGSSYADIGPGDTQEVLCLVPWRPVFVNGGHECLVVVAHGIGDDNPIPDPLPNGFNFDPPAHHQVAQLNLSVLDVSMLGVPLSLFVNAVGRESKRARLSVEMGARVDERLLANFGLSGLEPAREQGAQALLGMKPLCRDEKAESQVEVDVPRDASVPVFLHLDAARLPARQYQLVHVVERVGDRVAGGVSFLIVNAGDEKSIGTTRRKVS